MKLGLQSVSIKALKRRNWLATEMRTRINETKVAQYALEIRDGAKFPAPTVFIDKHDELMRVGDGFHRILAYAENGDKQITVDLRQGGFREAFLWNIEANRQQKGMPFSLGDKEKCIVTILGDPETGKWSGSKIAETVGASNGYVSQVITAWKEAGNLRPERTVDKHGVARRAYLPRTPEAVQERKEKVLELYQHGKPKIAIARNLGLTRFTVQRYLHDSIKSNALVTCPHCNGTGMVQAKTRA